MVEHVEFLVEEASMEAALELLLPRMLRKATFKIHSYQGKPDLLGQLPQRLRGYKAWIPQTWRIIVIVDRDDEDCETLKRKLETMSRQAGLRTRSAAGGEAGYLVVNRLAIAELEAWFFGDWEAVREAYPKAAATIPAKAAYRAPDAIRGGTHEALERVLQQAGYFTSGLRKIELARAVAKYMVPSRNTSPSFCSLRDALRDLGA
jgi:hypothetical protein